MYGPVVRIGFNFWSRSNLADPHGGPLR